jgi:hypothetical protein
VCAPVLTPELRDYPRPYLLKALQLFRGRGLTSIVEIGCMRMPMNHPIDELHIECCMDSHSSMYWAAETRDVDIVDVDPAALDIARREIDRVLGPSSGARFASMDGILFLQARARPIDLLFLDAWDADLPESASKHLEAFVAAEKHLHERSLVLVDDTDCERIDGVLHLSNDGRKGKGALVIPYAESRGWRVAFSGRQTLLERGAPG